MSRIRAFAAMLRAAVTNPVRTAQFAARAPDALKAASLTFDRTAVAGASPPGSHSDNPLRRYFDAHREGPGIWKWHHYFDVYHRHLAKFIGSDAHLVEIGVYSGGSLGLWHDYLGPRGLVTGIDIAPECKVYESDRTRIEIGDQADRQFWARFRAANPRVDILIDDGGHQPDQQRITLEEMVPHLAPGGVYICEDVHGRGSHFAAFCHALADQLNSSAMEKVSGTLIRSRSTPLQAAIDSIHFYPFAVVIERSVQPREALLSEKHGTEWQPFLKV